MVVAENLTRFYGSTIATKDISFSIDEHMIVGFLGRNGAGKSTLLKMIAGILPPHSGSIFIDKMNIWDAGKQRKNNVGYLSEEPALYRDMRVNAFLKWSGKLHKIPSTRLEKRVEEVINMCDLREKQHAPISSLSHGFRKRVGIAQAILHQPKLVILDEPFSGLDPIQMASMRHLLKTISDDAIVLLSSHILSEISQICDRILVIKDGVLVADGKESEIAPTSTFRYLFTFTHLNTSLKIELDSIFELNENVVKFTFLGFDKKQYELRLGIDFPETILKKLVFDELPLRTVEPLVDELENAFTHLVGEK